ncbi:hypothetical protein ACFOEK_19400 [Litoribrevibacter euphylliae]|uniref:ATP-grasp domain-containing protein n=1 Tax=Litoribrevibacter euphylliae TaxID=1834034 RepID=A0ABV7HH64_9GAMM
MKISEKINWLCDCHPGVNGIISPATAHLVETLLSSPSNEFTHEQIKEFSFFKYGNIEQAKTIAKTWINSDDADLWGMLSRLMNKHPEWSDQQCRHLIQTWMKLRLQNAEQAQNTLHWQQRWKKQHHNLLKKGLANTQRMSWAELCRYCEIWTVCRRIMPPFSGIASTLLSLISPEDTKTNHSQQLTSDHSTIADISKAPDILVITPHENIAEFLEFNSSKQLVWALENSGFSWLTKQPWDKTLVLDSAVTKGVIFWSYRHRRNDYVHHAMAVEKACIGKNIPVINSIIKGWDSRHSTVLENLRFAGIPCPSFQKFTQVKDIKLNYPLILRVDGVHRGQQMHLVHCAQEATKLINRIRCEFLNAPSGTRVWPQPNLAVEFIDVSDQQHQYQKRRAYVIGDQLLLRHLTISNHWLVNFASKEAFEDSKQANHEFLTSGEPQPELLVNAGLASGSEITALDYAKKPDGSYVFWEANRHFRMNGDKDYSLPDIENEEKAKRRFAKNRKLGEALLTLLQERFGPAIHNHRSITSA